jgi:DNA-binding NarL/FixJ family response regulator
MPAIRVLIVDDGAQVRRDLRTLLALAGSENQPRIEIVGEAANGLEAVRLAGVLQPEVVLMDLEMPVMDGYQAARQIKALCPEIRLIALTVHDYPAARQGALQAGMEGFIIKGAPVETLFEAVLSCSSE